MKRYRFILLATAGLAYMAFAALSFPYVGISVMLPSILLCVLSTWLYDYRIGLLVLTLTHPYYALMVLYHQSISEQWSVSLTPIGVGISEQWHDSLQPTGVVVQLCAVFFTTVISHNYNKSREIKAQLETLIRERSDELQRIATYMIAQSEAERSRLSEALCNILAYQQTELCSQCEAMKNILELSGAPQIGAADKLMQIAKQSIEQVQSISQRLDSRSISGDSLGNALRETCAAFKETAGADISVVLSGQLEGLPEKIALNIHHIAQEVVSNALRHGKATHVDLSLKVEEQRYILEVINNGNPLPAIRHEGLGMKLIRQRAEILHAKTRLGTIKGGKTRFECIGPLHTHPSPGLAIQD